MDLATLSTEPWTDMSIPSDQLHSLRSPSWKPREEQYKWHPPGRRSAEDNDGRRKQAFPKQIFEHSNISPSFPEKLYALAVGCIKGESLEIPIRLEIQLKILFPDKLYKADTDN